MPKDKPAKRDVAKEIRMAAIERNKKKPAKVVNKKEKRSSFAEALSNALDVFRVGKTVKKAAEK